MSRVVVEARGLTVGWSGEPLLEKLDFEVASGDVFAILGGSGTGKSTLLRHLIGLEAPLGGTIEVNGEPPSLVGRPRHGVLFQSGALFGSMSLLENVVLPLRHWTDVREPERREIAAAKLRLVGLGGFEHYMPAEISGGMKKRAGIARALALDPELLFLDEPSAGLDPVTSSHLDDLILSLNQNLGVTIVIVTHELHSIFQVVSRCILLHRERRGIIATGDPRELARTSTDVRVREFFRSADAAGRHAGNAQ
ncbi:Methionine import ATP-binding protein MetN 2 [Planctomycetes bacterium Pla163]|uniref:Methionine import ATP-binding protein MetN 2 n=1 Tax=Rohdeia mirabilis TaxID=2528008 RepID=A0A518D2T9_9BACT|nr:Methionine import ATP-binding protein MetN 2 [Planctomycetes bacterium Pla163]